jgi:hypothetical protein
VLLEMVVVPLRVTAGTEVAEAAIAAMPAPLVVAVL